LTLELFSEKGLDLLRKIPERTIMRKLIGTLLLITLPFSTCLAYGPAGHSLIGGVADKILAGKPTATKISVMLNGMSLAQAALLADDIKALDENKPFLLPPQFNQIRQQMLAFWMANKPASAQFYHRNFHYTDIPVVGNEVYSSSTVGRSNTDIVHMINFCINVLQGNIPENNSRKITKPVAIILLAHYVGDIHQPLHVGAEYFTSQGQIFEPTTANEGFNDQGGNKITLKLFRHSQIVYDDVFHAYWDNQTVSNARSVIRREMMAASHTTAVPTENQIERWLATHQPNWQLQTPTPLAKWAEAWANDIMPMSQEAHNRLIFSQIGFTPHSHTIARGNAREKTNSVAYEIWAANTVRMEMHKAGWRLAALLAEALQ
jgi:hypothetical protein